MVVKNYHGGMDPRYLVPQHAIGASTSINTANQLDEVNQRLNAGVFGVDLAPIDPKILESIPREHMKEIQRLAKLNNARVSLHGPIADLVGLDQSGRRIDEKQRKFVENQLNFFVERAHALDEHRNVPVNFHISTQIPGDRLRKVTDEEYTQMSDAEKRSVKVQRGSFGEIKFVKESMGVINQDTGEIIPMERKVKHYPWGTQVHDPDSQIRVLNEKSWDDDRLKVFRLQKEKDELMDRKLNLLQQHQHLLEGEKKGILYGAEKERLQEVKQTIGRIDHHMQELQGDVHLGIGDLFHKLDYVDPKYKNKVNALRDEIKKGYKSAQDEVIRLYKQEINDRAGYEKVHLAIEEQKKKQDNLLHNNLNKIGDVDGGAEIPKPEVFKRATDFAIEKSAETVSNAAYKAWKSYGKNSPLLTLENYRHDLTIGSASELREAVEKSQDLFVNKLMKDGMSKDEARKTSRQLIGVTWDVGHINFLRTQGLEGEELKKKILDEAREIAPHVKQLHLNDNFGFDDVHLPPGMGTAPIREQIEMLQKHGFKLEKGNAIAEAGGFVGQFKTNPHLDVLSYFDSPLFQHQAPYWSNIWETEGSYWAGYGNLPDVHFRNIYGAGFTNLPPELGGVGTGEDRSRFAGRA